MNEVWVKLSEAKNTFRYHLKYIEHEKDEISKRLIPLFKYLIQERSIKDVDSV